MTTLQHDFNGHSMTIIEHNNDYWLTSEQIAHALDYDDKRAINKIYHRNKALLDDYSTVVNLTTVRGKQRQTRVFNEEGVMLIAMKSNQPKAVSFQKWAVKVLKNYRAGIGDAGSLNKLSLEQEHITLQADHIALQDKYITLLKQSPNSKANTTKLVQDCVDVRNIYIQPRGFNNKKLKRNQFLGSKAKAEIVQLVKAGYSKASIAEYMGCSRTTVYYTLNGYYGVPRVEVCVEEGGVA